MPHLLLPAIQPALLEEANAPRAHTRIEVLRKCGAGAYGDVYEGEMADHHKVAVKLVGNSYRSKNKAHALRQEAEILRRCKRLNIPNVISVKKYREGISVLKEDGKYFFQQRPMNAHYNALVVSMAEQGDLGKALRSGPMPEEKVKELAVDILSALKGLHEHKIVHRDVKPENIVRHNDAWKLIDFGVAKQREAPVTPCGTPYYMAPEIGGFTRYTSTVDVWSLGVVLFKAVNGTYPFEANSAAELNAKRHSFINGYLTLKFKPQVSHACQKFILHLLQSAKTRPSAEQALNHPYLSRLALPQIILIAGPRPPYYDRPRAYKIAADPEVFVKARDRLQEAPLRPTPPAGHRRLFPQINR